MIKRSDKRGMEMAISSIILIILAVVILVAILFLFTKASAGFKDKVGVYFGSSNVDGIVENCNTLVNQEASYEYCCISKTIKVSKTETLDIPCMNASEKSWGKNIQKLNCENIC